MEWPIGGFGQETQASASDAPSPFGPLDYGPTPVESLGASSSSPPSPTPATQIQSAVPYQAPTQFSVQPGAQLIGQGPQGTVQMAPRPEPNRMDYAPASPYAPPTTFSPDGQVEVVDLPPMYDERMARRKGSKRPSFYVPEATPIQGNSRSSQGTNSQNTPVTGGNSPPPVLRGSQPYVPMKPVHGQPYVPFRPVHRAHNIGPGHVFFTDNRVSQECPIGQTMLNGKCVGLPGQYDVFAPEPGKDPRCPKGSGLPYPMCLPPMGAADGSECKWPVTWLSLATSPASIVGAGLGAFFVNQHGGTKARKAGWIALGALAGATVSFVAAMTVESTVSPAGHLTSPLWKCKV